MQVNPGTDFKKLKSRDHYSEYKRVQLCISVHVAHKGIKLNTSDIILRMRYLSALTNLQLVSEHLISS